MLTKTSERFVKICSGTIRHRVALPRRHHRGHDRSLLYRVRLPQSQSVLQEQKKVCWIRSDHHKYLLFNQNHNSENKIFRVEVKFHKNGVCVDRNNFTLQLKIQSYICIFVSLSYQTRLARPLLKHVTMNYFSISQSHIPQSCLK